MRDLHTLLHRIHDRYEVSVHIYINIISVYRVYVRRSGSIVSPCISNVHACECVFAFFSKIVTYDFRRSSRVYCKIPIQDRCCSSSRNSTHTHTLHTHFNCLLSPDCTLTSTHTAIVCIQLIMTSARRAR